MSESTSIAPAAPVEKFRRDYQAHAFAMEQIALQFDLQDGETIVQSEIRLKRQGAADAPLLLDGEDLETLSICIDGRELQADEYSIVEDVLRVESVPDSFVFAARVRIVPEGNTQLSGLYRTQGVFCTQCEAEGFRRITWSIDRPDALTRYSVRMEADQASCPVLLSNGNLMDSGALESGRHFAVWEDPFPKPSYLFALVAGDLGSLHDQFVTASGRKVELAIYTEHRNADRLQHAMDSLKHSMKWDEDVYGLEYDLDIYNIVAVEDFNMGAMENKSLNVFNTAYVLAKPDTATDADFANVEAVIAHEYFHNWTGNRVTCRDWFQLTLKEGLTVYRDQRFSQDMGSAAVHRIESVRGLRAGQFPEDAGPMAHPIRPESYIAMDNFYTATVYMKGAEVIRMMEVLVGRDGFRKGMDLYFERHDGQAVTCDDFRAAMADANGIDLDQFENWYLQAGTPVLKASSHWDADAGRLTLELEQECAPTPGQDTKQPFHLPVAVGLIGQDGAELAATRVLELKDAKQKFDFDGLPSEPVVSMLRGFSAPVRLKMQRSDDELAHLLNYDTDAFARWEAGQELASRVILGQVTEVANGQAAVLPDHLLQAMRGVLSDTDADPALRAAALLLPGESALAGELDLIDPIALHHTRRGVRKRLGHALRGQWFHTYQRLASTESYRFQPSEVGRRSLRNTCLAYLTATGIQDYLELAFAQFESADNMTDRLAALACLVDQDDPLRARALQIFERDWQVDALVMDKWFALQAMAARPDALADVTALLKHPKFSMKNPNKVRSLIRSFSANTLGFHRADGEGYRFMADRVLELDPLNPQTAARLVGPLGRWRRYAEPWGTAMRAQLTRIQEAESLSKDSYEMVSKSLAESCAN